MRVLGIGFLGLMVWYMFRLWSFVTNPETTEINIEWIALVAIPFVMGLFLLIGSFQKATNMEIHYAEKVKVLSLRAIEKEGRLNEMIEGFRLHFPNTRLLIH